MLLLNDARSEDRINERLSQLGLEDPMGYVDGADMYEFVLDDPADVRDPRAITKSCG